MKPKILFFTGASGAGKTSLVNALQKKLSANDTIFLYFDSVGIPSDEEIVKQYGSGENWQKETTKIWVNKMLSEHHNAKLILFEGQVNLLFIKQAFTQHNFNNYNIVLVHSDNEERHKRLIHQRKQAEFVNEEMDNWSKFLYNQAKEENAYILDTTNQNLEDLIELCITEFDL